MAYDIELERLYDDHAQALFAFLLRAELIGPDLEEPVDRPKPSAPEPRSDRHREVLMM